MLARGEYDALERLSGGARLSAIDLDRAVREYARTLTVPPPGREPPLDVVEIRDARPRAWSVNVPMWSHEEGRSDLTLQLTVIDVPRQGYRVEIDDLHVL
jgi:hypothetical protein